MASLRPRRITEVGWTTNPCQPHGHVLGSDEAKGLRRPPAPHPVSRLRGNPLHTSCLAQAELGPHGANHPEDPKRATIGVNLYSQWKGFDARIRRPPKEIAANPKLVKAEEYAAILKRIENAEERLVVRLLHDTGLLRRTS